MSTELQTRPTTSTIIPKVNLLPPEIGKAARLRVVKLQLGAGIVATVGVVGLLFIVASGQVTTAEEALAQAQAETQATQTEVASLSGVTKTYAEVAAAQANLTAAMGNEVRWSQFLTDLSLSTPSTVSVTSVVVSQGQDTVESGGTSVLGNPGIADVKFTGYSVTKNDLAKFLDKLAVQNNQIDAFYTKGEAEAVEKYEPLVWGFDASTTVTSDALSHRYTEGGQ